MTMQPKIIWIICLIIGISFFLNSCNKYAEYAIKTTYTYSNLSDYPLNIKVFNKLDQTQIADIPVPSGDSVQVILIGDGIPVSPFFYEPDIASIGDSVSVIFDNTKYLYYTKDIMESILDYRSYEGGKVSKTVYYYRFKFTNEDYDRALEL
jgi:hypothetical protein